MDSSNIFSRVGVHERATASWSRVRPTDLAMAEATATLDGNEFWLSREEIEDLPLPLLSSTDVVVAMLRCRHVGTCPQSPETPHAPDSAGFTP